MTTTHTHSTTMTLDVPTGRRACDCCRDEVEQRLRAHPHVRSAKFDWDHQVAHVQVDDSATTATELAELVACACGERNPVPLPQPEVSSHAHRQRSRDGSRGHGPPGG
jgi:cation transport ATPase